MRKIAKIHQVRNLLTFLGGGLEVLMAFTAMLTVSVFLLQRPMTPAADVLLVIWNILWLVVFDKGVRNVFQQRRTRWTKFINITGAVWEVIGSLWLIVGTIFAGHGSAPLNLLSIWTNEWPFEPVALWGYGLLALLGAGQLVIHPILVRRARRRMMA